MHRLAFSLTLIALGLLASPSAHAASPKGNSYYGSFYAGPVVATGEEDVPLAYSFTSNQATARWVVDYETSPEAGYDLGGSFGMWFGEYFRAEFSLGYRSYDADATTGPLSQLVVNNAPVATPTLQQLTNVVQRLGLSVSQVEEAIGITLQQLLEGGVKISGEVNVVPLMFSGYAYPFKALGLGVLDQLYLGAGIGVGFWSFDDFGVDDDRQSALMVNAAIGYDVYLSDQIVIGIAYQFSWSKPELEPVEDAAVPFAGREIDQNSHMLQFAVKYEF